VARRTLEAGASIVNDVTALGDPEMASVVARAGAGVVLMHMQGTPRTMQREPHYEDAAREVSEWLRKRLEAARRAGIAEECVALDPGIGFGKTARHNFELLARLPELAVHGRPVVVGVSRKSFLGKGAGPQSGHGDHGVTRPAEAPDQAPADLPPDQRLEGGLAATAIAVFLGASIVRTHDVAATLRAVRIAGQMREARRAEDVSSVEGRAPFC
jgi:dihydropteroate synthase